MPMNECPECRGEIPEGAEVCPHCGKAIDKDRPDAANPKSTTMLTVNTVVDIALLIAGTVFFVKGDILIGAVCAAIGGISVLITGIKHIRKKK